MVFIRKPHENQLVFVTEKSIINYNCANSKHGITEIPSKLPKSQENQNKIKQTEENSSAVVTSIDFSKNCDYFVVTKENKHVIVYESAEFKVVKEFLSQRAASKACFTQSNDIIVADKTGDVYLYKLNEQTEQPATLLLGHSSMILDLILSECGKFIITCDRDEKIRVSRFPNAYNIVSYCLGHTEFVIALKTCGDVLISASGDGTVRFWKYVTGEQCAVIKTNDYIENKTKLDGFVKEMDGEKVEITALPVREIQTHRPNEGEVLIATKIHEHEFLQIHRTDLNSFENTFLQNVPCGPCFSFYFGVNLYVLSPNGLEEYNTKTTKTYEAINNNKNGLKEFYAQYKQHLETNNRSNIATLYKRKFDNMQEYLERKKMRMDLK